MATAIMARPAEKPRVSLFDIETGLHSLVEAWQEASTPESIKEAEDAIREYVQAEVRKVDGIRKYLKCCATMIQAAKEEIELQKHRVELWTARQDRLKSFTLSVMEAFGVKKLDGETGSLLVKGNGGKQPLTITDESLVPDDLCDVTVSMPAKLWNRIEFEVGPEYLAPAKVSRTPNGDRIREALQAGEAVGGARLDHRGVHLEVK